MRNFMSRMNDNLRHFMYGRYGVDSFGRFLIGAMFVLIVLSIFIRSWILQVLIWGVLIYSYFRMFSRNIPKRYAENQNFTCPKCGQDVRVPKGKGHVRITCPKCRTSFEKNV